jgi:tRNA G18 (ribose-2'-O)-methylase SpoU
VRVERIDTGRPDWLDDPRLQDYRLARSPDRLQGSEVFLAEGLRVVEILLARSPLRARSILATEVALDALRRALGDAPPDVPVRVVPSEAMHALGGHRFHQGILAAGDRPRPIPPAALLAGLPRPARTVVALDRVTDPDNVGAIFRSAAALGAEAVVLSPPCASPLYRKAIRTSMGTSLWLPFSHGAPWEEGLAALAAHGLVRVALDPDPGVPSLESVRAGLGPGERVALVMGAEGTGLSRASRDAADVVAGIPLSPDVDSLNVAAAAAIALYRLATPPGPR